MQAMIDMGVKKFDLGIEEYGGSTDDFWKRGQFNGYGSDGKVILSGK